MLAASRSWRAGVALVLICLTVYLPGLFTIPPIDRDESRFAQASRQMFEAAAFKGSPQWREDFHSGGWVVPHVQDRPRLNKPPLVYWLQVASAWVFAGGDPLRDAIWMYRVPGVLCAIASVLLTWRMGLKMFDPRAAWLASVFLAVCPVVVFDAHQARADQLLLTLTIATMWALWEVWKAQSSKQQSSDLEKSKRQRWSWVLFWVFLGLSILAKGPITPMIAALTCVAISLATQSWQWMWKLRPLVGLLIVAVIVGPWVYAVGAHVGWEQYLAIIKDETIGRSMEAKEGHWGPPGYHTVLLAVLFWPGSLTTAMAVVNAWKRARGGGGWRGVWTGRHAELFLLAWIVPAWVVFELVGTKLPHYTLPMYPAIALLSARTLLGLRVSSLKAVDRVGQWVWAAIAVVISTMTCFALMSLNGGHLPSRPSTVISVPAFIGIVMACVVLVDSIRTVDVRNAQIAGVVLSVPLSLVLFGLYAPLQWDRLWMSNRIMDRILQVDETSLRPIAAVGYQEDSLIFLSRGRARRITEDQIEEWLKSNPASLIVIDSSAFEKRSDLRLPQGHSVRPVHGFNYARGRSESVIVAEMVK